MLPHQKRPIFTRVLTGPRQVHGSVHGLLLIDKLKTLSIFANSVSATLISSPGIKGFTGLISISSNKINGPHGFTGLAPYSPAFCLCLCLCLFICIFLFLCLSRTLFAH